MDEIKINSQQYIDYQLRNLSPGELIQEQQPKFSINLMLSLRTLFSGRKWVIFVVISLLPMLISILASDPLFGNETPKEAFVDFFIGIFFLFLFGWGALVISLPISADDISDNMIDLYLVRPIRRDSFWLSRWIANFIGLFLLNLLIAFIYYLYFHLADTPEDIFSNLSLMVSVMIFLVFATLTYGGLYLVVGSIGDRGFTLGVVLAIFEPYFLSLLFLQSSRYIPRNNVLKMADMAFGSSFDLDDQPPPLNSFPSSLTTLWAISYVLIFALIFLLLGTRYYRRRDFH
ncbi:MAG: hypothetical protein ACW99A_06190 [Candidatus Kariarchaeaceae archaeon]|jgi:ABC-type transport system involved in multi-copper enzyme maturation permease subunit